MICMTNAVQLGGQTWVLDRWHPRYDVYEAHRLGFASRSEGISGQLVFSMLHQCPRVGSFGDVDR
jgi:hypothetical protein